MAQCLIGSVDKPAEVPAIDVFVRGFAGGVVAAGQHSWLKVEAVVLECLDDLKGILKGEGEVVFGVDEHDLFVRAAGFGASKTLVVAARTDG